MERLKLALRLGAQTLTHPAMDGFCDTVFPTSYSSRVAKLAAPGFGRAVQRGAFAAMLDVAGALRASLIHGFVTQGIQLDALLADDDALTAFVARNVGGTWHPTCTCRMGSANDPLAVADGAGRVYGLQNLRICDASLMPSIPRANTNAPTIMLAERLADLIKMERREA
jgi:5-(hydroxymethyl)furfural/furfural oxidase